ncbi:5336_t:CDS:2, partial [Racocetra persica]
MQKKAAIGIRKLESFLLPINSNVNLVDSDNFSETCISIDMEIDTENNTDSDTDSDVKTEALMNLDSAIKKLEIEVKNKKCGDTDGRAC